MITIIIATTAVVPAGAYLRWATRPVLAAYDLGRQLERVLRRDRGRQQVRSRCPR